VVLVNPPYSGLFIRTGRWLRETRAYQNWYPILLGYCCGLLIREGHECLLLDAEADRLGFDSTVKKIEEFKPSWVVVYWGYDSRVNDFMFADRLLKRGFKVVLASPWSYCLSHTQFKRETQVPYMTYGEFDHTVLELVSENKHPSQIQGLIWKDEDNTVHVNPRRPLCSPEELDRFPYVTKIYKRFLNLYNYRQTSLRYPYVDLYSSRGCPWFKCIYCVFPRSLQGKPSYRCRSIRNVMDELWYIHDFIPEVKQVYFQDDTLTERRMREIAQAILDEGLKICWGGECRPEISFEALKLAKESGLRTLQVGYETCIQRHLNIIEKGTTVERITRFAEDIHKLGIWTSMSLMIFPWMTPEEFKFTIEWAKRMKPTRINLMMAIPYPNTPFHDLMYKLEWVDEGGFEWIYPERLLSREEMMEWERWGFKQFYLYNPRFWLHVLTHPSEWRNVLRDALGLLKFIVKKR